MTQVALETSFAVPLLVATAGVHHDVPLTTCDQRARDTYSAAGARVTPVG